MLRIGRLLAPGWLFALLIGFGLWRCATDPPDENWLRLELNDSLSHFDSVHIDLLDPADPSRVLQVIFSGLLADPGHMKEVKLLIPASQAYEVRVRAWNEEKDLGWETIIIPKDGDYVTYRTVLPPLKPYLVDLSELSVSNGTLDPPFQPARTSYDLTVGFLVDTIHFHLTTADSRAGLKILAGTDSIGRDSATIKLEQGNSEIAIVVTNKGNRTETYRVKIIQSAIPDPRLRALKTSEGTLIPDFNPEHAEYSLALPYSIARLSFTTFSADTFATVIVKNDTLDEGRNPNSMAIPVGKSTIDIHVIASTKRMDYTIDIMRADTIIDTTKPPVIIDEPPYLLNLSFSEAAIQPPFNDLIHEYQMNVEDTVTEAHIKTILCDTGITVYLPNDTLSCGETPKAFPLQEGSNTLNLRLVTNSTQAETTYTVTILRKLKFRLAGFANSARIRVNTMATGANVLGRVTAYPLLLRLRPNNFDFSLARRDGRDLRVVKSDGTLLPREIEQWDSAAGIADIWVRIDTIPGNSIKDVAYLCWNNPTAPAVVQPASVFSPTNGFAAVWHMDSTFQDATGNLNRGYPRMNAAADTSGIVGLALKTNGTNQGVDFGNGVSLSTLTSNIQFEGWVRSSQSGVAASVFRHDRHFMPLQLLPNTGAQSALYTKYTDTTKANDSLKTLPFEWKGKYDDNAWHQIVVQYESNAGLVVFWDGRVVASDTKLRGTLNSTTKSFMLGITETNTDAFKGLTDEVRFQSTVRSSDWVKLNYEVIKSNSTVVSLIP